MPWRPPRVETFGRGRRRWDIRIRVLPDDLFEAQSEIHDHAEPMKRSGEVAFWCCTCRLILLRTARRPLLRLDFLHELHHAYIDWAGANHEQ